MDNLIHYWNGTSGNKILNRVLLCTVCVTLVSVPTATIFIFTIPLISQIVQGLPFLLFWSSYSITACAVVTIPLILFLWTFFDPKKETIHESQEGSKTSLSSSSSRSNSIIIEDRKEIDEEIKEETVGSPYFRIDLENKNFYVEPGFSTYEEAEDTLTTLAGNLPSRSFFIYDFADDRVLIVYDGTAIIPFSKEQEGEGQFQAQISTYRAGWTKFERIIDSRVQYRLVTTRPNIVDFTDYAINHDKKKYYIKNRPDDPQNQALLLGEITKTLPVWFWVYGKIDADPDSWMFCHNLYHGNHFAPSTGASQATWPAAKIKRETGWAYEPQDEPIVIDTLSVAATRHWVIDDERFTIDLDAKRYCIKRPCDSYKAQRALFEEICLLIPLGMHLFCDMPSTLMKEGEDNQFLFLHRRDDSSCKRFVEEACGKHGHVFLPVSRIEI